ncbi:MAG: ThuA domain-containing protein, partial [Armatimonadota bacterium]
MLTMSRPLATVLLAVAIVLPLADGSAEAGPAAPLRVLLLSGKNNHDWKKTTPALQAIYEQSGRFAVDVTEDPSSCDAEQFAQYDLVVSNWSNFPSQDRAWGAEAEEAVLSFVREGKGFALFHAASACLWQWPEYHQLIGAAWALGATGHGAVHTFDVAVADRAHPITRGMRPFSTRDELWHKVAIQPTARVLCTAFSAEDRGGTGEDEPVAVVTRLGKGRCFNLILGHDVR